MKEAILHKRIDSCPLVNLYIWVSFIHLLNKHLLRAYYVPGTVLSTGDTVINKTKKTSCPYGAYMTLSGDIKLNNNFKNA